MNEPEVDNRSPMHEAFLAIASRCVALLRDISDSDRPLRPIDIVTVQNTIVNELAKLYFNGLESEPS